MSNPITRTTRYELRGSAAEAPEAQQAEIREVADADGITLDEGTWEIETEHVADTWMTASEESLVATWRTIEVSSVPEVLR